MDKDTYTFEYTPRRGLEARTFAFYNSRTKVASDGKPHSVGFPYPNGAIKVRLLDQKKFYWEGSPEPGLFGMDKFDAGAHKAVTITEGEYDALSFHQALQGPAVSVRSSSSAASDCGAARAWLDTFERVYIAMDGDKPGREATRAVAQLFNPNKVYDVRFTRPDRKDANDYLQSGEVNELVNLWHNAKRYVPDNIISSLADFREIVQKKVEWGVPYPFPTLSKMTYGIRRGEFVLVTAREKVGKTAFMHHLQYKLLRETEDNVAGIFNEEPPERHLKTLAGLHLGVPLHLPDCNIAPDRQVSALEEVVPVDGRLYVYNHYGSDDPDTLLDTIRFLVSACNVVYVLFDHVSMAVSGLQRSDERKTFDYIITKLVEMVKSLNFALIVVSHVNDEGQTRGSHYFTKAADIVINLDRDNLNPDPEVRNSMYLTVPYNRYCHMSGPAGKLVFDEQTYRLKEEGNEWLAANDNWPNRLAL